MTQNEAKRKIQELVSKYEQVKSSGEIRNYSEQSTKDSFIRPLFEALGWNFTVVSEVSAEENVQSVGRADYGMRLNGQVKFYLEAKKLSADLYIENHAKQAISYSFNRVVTWAVLTDFEGLIVFNAQSHSKVLEEKKYLSFNYKTYLDDFDKLWLLSKEAFTTDQLDKEARKVGKLREKLDVTVKLAQTLNEARDLLTKTFNQCNSGLSPNDLDEGVQKLLDRLIFLRVAEDRLIEPNILMRIVREWKAVAGQIPLYRYMITEFRKLDKTYNSGLFSKHGFENWEEYGGATEKVVKMLYGEEGYYDYNFGAITTDVLGAVYENYLGYQLAKSRKGLSLDKSTKKRKEQGIYYTPAYIEDYILEQSLQPVLDQCTSVAQLKSIKVVDPACGSGSFLVKALQLIAKKYESFGAKNNGMIRAQILLDNIYGVDLDEKAVELARLNLLISAFDSQTKLPGLDKNIRQGNSLISGTDEELKKYFGNNFRDKKPFNWEEEFPEVFNRPNPGFDVIIGNPPWVTTRHSELGADLVSYLKNRYKSAEGFKLNLFPMFVELSLMLTRKEGISSLIIPNRLLDTPSYVGIRESIINNMTILAIQNLPKGAFDSVVAGNIIIAIQNKRNTNANKQIIITDFFTKEQTKLSIQDILSTNNYTININGTSVAGEVINSIKSIQTTKLSELCAVHVGMMIKDKNNKLKTDGLGSKKIIVGRDFERYQINNFRTFNFGDIEIFGGTKRPEKHEVSPKLFVRKTGNRIVAVIDKNNIYAEQSVYLLLPKTNMPVEYLEGILNSKLISYYFQNELITNPESYPYIQHYDLEKLPVVIPEKLKQQNDILEKVDTICKLKHKLKRETENSNRWNQLTSEIKKTDKQIDQLVYRLYGLTEDEIKIIEGGNHS